MRYRPLVAVALGAALFATMPAHAGGTKVLDGKKTKVLTFSAAASPQDNDLTTPADVVNLAGQSTPFDRPDYAHCPKTRCLSYSFKYAPAKGVKPAPVSVRIDWTIPGQDYDLYVIDHGADVGHCGASAGTSEVVVIPAIKGHVYTVVVDEYRAGPDTVKGSISFPAKDSVKKTTGDPEQEPVDCGLS